MFTTSLFPAFSFSLESEERGCDRFCETDKVFGKIQVIIVCNTSDQDLVVESLASDEENFLRYTNILLNQKMVSLSTTPPSKDSKFFFNQFIFYGKNDEKDKLVVRVEYV